MTNLKAKLKELVDATIKLPKDVQDKIDKANKFSAAVAKESEALKTPKA